MSDTHPNEESDIDETTDPLEADEDAIEVEEVEIEDAEADSDLLSDSGLEEKGDKPRKGLGVLPVLGLFLLSTGLGAVGGAYGAQHFVKTPNKADIQRQLDLAVAEVKDESSTSISALKNEVSRLRQDQASLQNIEGVDVTQLNDLESRLQERLETLENRPEPVLPDINADTLQALKQAEEDGFAWPDTSGLEARLAELETALIVSNETITKLEAEIDDLKQSRDILPMRVEATDGDGGEILTQSPAFPKAALLAAIEKENGDKGFLAKALNKHIQVREPDDPIVLIETIETALSRGDLNSAIKTFESLPQNLRNVGQDWRNSLSVNE
jgi:hypothetical protein